MNILFQRHVVCERLIIGSGTTIRAQTLYVILQHVSALNGHHQVKYFNLFSSCIDLHVDSRQITRMASSKWKHLPVYSYGRKADKIETECEYFI
jgi:hypothetical protein